ncbi:HAD-IIIA family hydrolase [Niabella insulamsoli]|uniref:HAD-IIIA family hydrolase n=1 Tax=Niabella insulamsoli TaxID=3144874 RepID=UPI0031FC0424
MMSLQKDLSANQRDARPQKNYEAIILAGGLGTRLRAVVADLPKCMAPVAGRPFLYYVINALRMQGVSRIVFSLGYMHEAILDWLRVAFPELDYDFVVEKEPLGTGGAIRFALQKTKQPHVFVANGDTLFEFNAAAQLTQHLESGCECTLALKPMKNFDRYGVVEINDENIVTSFKEKQYYSEGLINAGLYLLNRSAFLKRDFTQKFSFEKEYLEKFVQDGIFSGLEMDRYFIDIGIPEDYQRAQHECTKPKLDLQDINNDWTLFLDRDGVINHDNPGGYITTPDEFIFTDGAPALFRQLTNRFKYIIVVTNQRGVGRGIIKYDDLLAMNEKMLQGISDVGGQIQKIYFCTDKEAQSFYRKPNPGMAFQAMTDFPDIDLKKSIVVGNSLSDMKFGRYAGLYTVFITSTNKNISQPHPDIDLIFESLEQFTNNLATANH